jgi:D-alanine-D-alanine ligase
MQQKSQQESICLSGAIRLFRDFFRLWYTTKEREFSECMMGRRKLRVGVLFGGKSVEHEVSLISAKNVIDAMDPEKYEIVLIAIDKHGEWHLKQEREFLIEAQNAKRVSLTGEAQTVAMVPSRCRNELVCYRGNLLDKPIEVDVIFPILHGAIGEDGAIQGLLTVANIPFVGAGVLGSAIGMDKDVMKRLLRDAQIPVCKFMTIYKHQVHAVDFDHVVKELGIPFFVKPANSGSSVGISKIKEKAQFAQAIQTAFEFSRKVILEEFIDGREIECSVLGNEYPIVSLPGEVIPKHEFYSYEAKYLDEQVAVFQIPVELPPDVALTIQKLAVDAYRVLCCEGMGRIDFFMTKTGQLFVNEINTIPGFTQISMYPKNWEASGLPYAELIDRLIALALERHASENELKTSLS